jgi:hypothetical protein
VAEHDPVLRRFERDAVLACSVLAVMALAWPHGGGPWAAASVAGGGLLAAGSYRATKGGVDAVSAGGSRGGGLVKYFTRYGILAVAAYVMLARLRLHPVGVVAGASSLVVAAALAAARLLRSSSRSGHPRF